jgi:phosphate transport system substrate-binding protein
MKSTMGVCFRGIVLLSFLCVLFDSPANAQDVLKFSCSSQIAEAYGKKIAGEFEDTTGISLDLYLTTSRNAVTRLVNGLSDLAATTRRISTDLRHKGYVEIPFCKDPLAVIAHPKCTRTMPFLIDNMTETQLRDIFSGRITNWKEFGGPDKPIIVIIPRKDSGAYQNFSRLVMGIDEIKYDFMTYQSTTTIEGIKYIPGSISFAAQGAVAKDAFIKTLKINGLSPKDKDYPIYQVFSFVTKGKPAHPANECINFALSKRGHEIIEERGMFPLLE